MARTAIVHKCQQDQKKAERARELGKKPEFSTRLYHRCSHCGRSQGYIGRFNLCRICIRERANAGELMGVRKSSW